MPDISSLKSNSTSGNIAVYGDASGSKIKDSGKAISTGTTRIHQVQSYYTRSGSITETMFATNSDDVAQIRGFRVVYNAVATAAKIKYWPDQLPEWVDVSEDISVYLMVQLTNGSPASGEGVWHQVYVDYFDPINSQQLISEHTATGVFNDLDALGWAANRCDRIKIGTIAGGTLPDRAVCGWGWYCPFNDNTKWTMDSGTKLLNHANMIILECTSL